LGFDASRLVLFETVLRVFLLVKQFQTKKALFAGQQKELKKKFS
jgi:hypothetical protein